MASEPEVLAEVAAAVERGERAALARRADQEVPLVAGEWEPGGDELTPTMKLKRKPIGESTPTEIDSLYAG